MSPEEEATLRKEQKAQEQKITSLESTLTLSIQRNSAVSSELFEARKKEQNLVQTKEHLERQLADMVKMTGILETLKGNGLDIERMHKMTELEKENERLMKEQKELVRKLEVKRMEIEEVNAKRARIEEAKKMAALEGSRLSGQNESGSV